MAIQRKYEEGELSASGFPTNMGEVVSQKEVATGTPTSSISSLPTYRADPTTGVVDYSSNLNQQTVVPDTQSPDLTTQYAEIQKNLDKQLSDFTTQYTQTLTDLSTSINDAQAQNKNLFTSGVEDLMKKVEESARQAGAGTTANSDFIQAAFSAFHGRNATQNELNMYAGATSVDQALKAIKLGAPKRTAGTNLSDFIDENDILPEGLEDSSNTTNDILEKFSSDPLNTYTEIKALEQYTATEKMMLETMNKSRESISKYMETQNEILKNMEGKITNTVEQWNIPEMVNAAWSKSNIEGNMANAEQYVQQANQLFNTVYIDTPDGSIPQQVLSRANAGKFAGLQAAANLSMGYAQNANNIINDHFTMMQNSVNSQISAYQSIMNEAGVNVRQGLSSDTSILNNQIAVLSDINSRIETKKQTILDFMSTAAAKFGEPIDLENDSEEVIAQKIAMANLKYGIYSTYAQTYPDTLQYINPSMGLDEIQASINMSKLYKDSMADGSETTTTPFTSTKWGVTFNGGDLTVDSQNLAESIAKINADTTLSDIQKRAEIAILESEMSKLYPDMDLISIFNDAELQAVEKEEEIKKEEISSNYTIKDAKNYTDNLIKMYKTQTGDITDVDGFWEKLGGLLWQSTGGLLSKAGTAVYDIISGNSPFKTMEELQQTVNMLEQVNKDYESGKITEQEYIDAALKSQKLPTQSGLTNVEGDTDSALPENVAQAETGSHGGQCGRFVNANTGLSMPNSYDGKMALTDPSIKEPKAGMVFVMPITGDNAPYGHTGFIKEVKGDKVLVKDSNWSNNNDEIIREHWIDKNKITGLIQV